MTTIEKVKVKTRSEAIKGWYLNVFPQVAAYVQRKGGDLPTAQEIFQESVVLYYEKWICPDFSPESNDEAYLIGIAKNKWRRYGSDQKRYESLTITEKAEEESQKPATQKLLTYLRLTGEKCMDMLQAFYYEKLNMAQLAHRFGYGSERSATVQKFKCLEKVRDEVKRKSMTYEDFLS